MKKIIKLVGILAILFALSACAEFGIFDGTYEGSADITAGALVINNAATVKITVVKTEAKYEITPTTDVDPLSFTGTITGNVVYDADDKERKIGTIQDNAIKGDIEEGEYKFSYNAKKK